jgi:uncharacterized protein (TIGR02145 family)
MKKNIKTLIFPLILIGILFNMTTGCKKSSTPDTTLKDLDGNTYNTIKIGSQMWMVQNLLTTKLNDGTPIPLVTDNTAWGALTAPGYCWYGNDGTTNKAVYGALYNWYTVNSGKLCPTGWHMPTDVEWTTLITYLAVDSIAGAILKETGTAHWLSPNTGATNASNFTALPGGYRTETGVFFGIQNYGFWWSSTENNFVSSWSRSLSYGSKAVSRLSSFKLIGASIRCVKN